jgi:multiple RNA-binding domain-containing protein 1
MELSRIFVRGLPPNITTEEFQRHFSKIGTITDTKLISHRRIGYIGYKTNNDAAKAVKYFNRTFIRLSKISVELARSVGPQNDLMVRWHSEKNPASNIVNRLKTNSL